MYKKLVVNMALWQVSSILGFTYTESDIKGIEKMSDGALMFYIDKYVVYISETYMSVRDYEKMSLVREVVL